MHTDHFTAELQADVARALHYYVSSHGGAPEALRLTAVRKAVCRHAVRTHMTPGGMVIGIGRAYESLTSYSIDADNALRGAYNTLVSDCVSDFLAMSPTLQDAQSARSNVVRGDEKRANTKTATSQTTAGFQWFAPEDRVASSE